MSPEIVRVAVYYNNRKVLLEERECPSIGEGELLVSVKACGICGSDLMEWYRLPKAPLVLGHELGGEIVEIGGGVRQWQRGDRVVISHHVPCLTCWSCLNGKETACKTLHNTNIVPGGFSELVRVPEINVERGVWKLPDELSYEEATLTEPLACVVRAQREAGLRPGNSLLVLGSGVAGLLHIAYARATGAGFILASDIHPYRLKAAQTFGADAVVNAQKEDLVACLQSSTGGQGADSVVVATAAPSAFQQAFQAVARGGTILFFAAPPPERSISLPMNALWRNSVKLLSSYGAAPYDMEIALRFLSSKRIVLSQLITHRFPLEETGKGFQLVAEAGESLKVIIYPSQSQGG